MPLFSQTGNTVSISHFENFVVLVIFQMWVAWLTNNRNNNTNLLHFCQTQGEANRMMWDGTILTEFKVCHHPLHSHSLTIIHTLGCHIMTFRRWKIITWLRELPVLHIPKSSHYLRHIFLWNDHSDDFVSQDQEFWMADAGKQYLKDNTSDIIMHCLCVWFLRTRRN